MKIKFKYDEKDIIWTVIGADEYKSLKNKLNPKKYKKLHTNNLKICEFTPGCWVEY